MTPALGERRDETTRVRVEVRKFAAGGEGDLGQRGFASHHAHRLQPGGTVARSRCPHMKRTTSPTELLLRIDRNARVPLCVQLERELRERFKPVDSRRARFCLRHGYSRPISRCRGALSSRHTNSCLRKAICVRITALRHSLPGVARLTGTRHPRTLRPSLRGTISGRACLTFRCFRAARGLGLYAAYLRRCRTPRSTIPIPRRLHGLAGCSRPT